MTKVRALPAPPITDPVALFEYADEHVRYEVEMFFGTVDARTSKDRVSVSPDNSSFSTTSSRTMSVAWVKSALPINANVESFIVHFRNLFGFLYPEEVLTKSSDVCAHHYIDASDALATWTAARPPLSPTLKLAKTRADKELAHLTRDRLPSGSRTKEWHMVPLAEEIRRVLLTFVETASSDRLPPSIRKAIPDGLL